MKLTRSSSHLLLARLGRMNHTPPGDQLLHLRVGELPLGELAELSLCAWTEAAIHQSAVEVPGQELVHDGRLQVLLHGEVEEVFFRYGVPLRLRVGWHPGKLGPDEAAQLANVGCVRQVCGIRLLILLL